MDVGETISSFCNDLNFTDDAWCRFTPLAPILGRNDDIETIHASSVSDDHVVCQVPPTELLNIKYCKLKHLMKYQRMGRTGQLLISH